jgi:hypothetical protein
MLNGFGTHWVPEAVTSQSRLVAGRTFEVICVNLRRGTRSAPRICAYLRRSAVLVFRSSAVPPFRLFYRLEFGSRQRPN